MEKGKSDNGEGVEAGYVSVRRFAARRGCTTQWVYKMLNTGRIQSVRSMATGQHLIPTSELEKVS